jgi:hypothetical protein
VEAPDVSSFSVGAVLATCGECGREFRAASSAASFFKASDAADIVTESLRGGRAGVPRVGTLPGPERGGNKGAGVPDLGVDEGNRGSAGGSSSVGVMEIVSIDAEDAAALGCFRISLLPVRLGVSLLLVLIVRWPNNRYTFWIEDGRPVGDRALSRSANSCALSLFEVSIGAGAEPSDMTSPW